MKDILDVIENIRDVYDSNTAFKVLKDYERVLDYLDLYVFDNWIDGELASGPNISRHWVECSFFWPKDKMPDPMGGQRLLDYDCKVTFTKTSMVIPRKITKPGDLRPGTKKGKLDKKPIWLVSIKMPKALMADMYQGYLRDQSPTLDDEPQPAETEFTQQQTDQSI